jgi:hypothetical protein
MKLWHKIAAAALAISLIGVAFVTVAVYRHVTRTVPDCYAQWAAAELVIGFRKEKGTMPSTWDELRPYYGVTAQHTGGLSFEEIERRIRIDFPALSKLELEYAAGDTPEVVVTVSGIGSHWDGAEPNQLIQREIRKQK